MSHGDATSHQRRRSTIRRVVVVATVSLATMIVTAPRATVHATTQTVVYEPNRSAYPHASVSSPRVIRLQYQSDPSKDGLFLASYDEGNSFRYTNEGGTPPGFSIYHSQDGASWSAYATTIQDMANTPATSFHQQPMLYELPRQVGGLTAGTILFAGNFEQTPGPVTQQNGQTIEEPMTQTIEIFASTDQGADWRYMGPCESGGIGNGHGIWEPYLQVDAAGNLVCYYSDERQRDGSPAYNQVIGEREAQSVSSTWISWGGEATAVRAASQVVTEDNGMTDTYDLRPGMPSIQRLSNNQYVMAYETVISGSNGLHDGYNTSDVRVKFSTDGLTWGAGPDDLGMRVQTPDGHFLGATPDLTYIPPTSGYPNGILVLDAKAYVTGGHAWDSDAGDMLLVNTNDGRGAWFAVPAPAPVVPAPTLNPDCNNYKPGLASTGTGTSVVVLSPQYVGTDQNGIAWCDLRAASETISPAPFAVGVGIDAGPHSDNEPRILWDYPDGTIHIDTITVDGQHVASTLAEHPVDSTWYGRGIAVADDGAVRVLWVTDTGAMSLWNIANGQVSSHTYPSFAPSMPIGVGVGASNDWAVLYRRESPTDHYINLWALSPDGGTLINNWGQAPADASWTAVGLAVGADNLARVLWNHTDVNTATTPWTPADRSTAIFWTLNAALWTTNTAATAATQGPVTQPYAGASAVGVGAGAVTQSEGGSEWRVLWANTDKSVDLWGLGPFGDALSPAQDLHVSPADTTWTVTAVATGTDDSSRVLWNNQRGSAVLWTTYPNPNQCPSSGCITGAILQNGP